MSEFDGSDRSMDERLREVLGKPRVVAVVGMSPKTDRPSTEVGLYLRKRGFTIVPIHPKATEIEGLKAYPDLASIPADTAVEIIQFALAVSSCEGEVGADSARLQDVA